LKRKEKRKGKKKKHHSLAITSECDSVRFQQIQSIPAVAWDGYPIPPPRWFFNYCFSTREESLEGKPKGRYPDWKC